VAQPGGRKSGFALHPVLRMFQLLQYISDLGGVLGLWFGFAIMTFIEFFEFFVDLAILTANKLSRC